MSIHSSFASTLRAQRGRESQSSLARRAQLNPSSISRLEAGERAPSRVLALRLANTLGLEGMARANFLAAAGFTSVTTDPLVNELTELLAREDVPPALRRQLRAGVATIMQIVRAAQELTAA